MVFSQAMVNENHVRPKSSGSDNWMIGNVNGNEDVPEEDMGDIGSEELKDEEKEE